MYHRKSTILTLVTASAILILTLIRGFAHAQNAIPRSVATTVFGMGNEPRLFVGDLDDSGFPEVLVLNGEERRLIVLRSDKARSYREVQTVQTISGPHGLVSGRLDPDPHVDIIHFRAYSDTAGAAFGDGSPFFPVPFIEFTLEDAGPASFLFTWDDLDRDGRLDLVTKSRNGLLVYAPAWALEPTSVPSSVTSPERAAIDDFDGDGLEDIVVWGPGTGASLSLLLGQVDGSFKEDSVVDHLPVPGGVPLGTVTADFDGDGRPEAALVAGDLPRGATQGFIYLFDLEDGSAVVTRHGPELRLVPDSFFQAVELRAIDLDGDGHVDLVLDVLDDNGERAWWVLRHKGTPEPSFATPCVLRPRERGGWFAFADMDQDGSMDIVESLPESEVVVVEFSAYDLCEPLGTCYSELPVAADHTFQYVDAADITGNGTKEVVVAGDGNVRVVSVHRDGTVDVLDVEGPADVGALGTGDLDGREPEDIVVGDAATGVLEIFVTDEATGAFARQTVPVGGRPSGLLVADIDADGGSEIIASCRHPDRVLILARDDRGVFAEREAIEAGPSPGALALGDVNGDGAGDLVVVNEGTTRATVLFADGAGSFGPPVPLRVVADAVAAVTADLDGDGAEEIVVASRRTDALTFLDYAGDRFDLRSHALAPGSLPTAVTVADLDRDGRVEIVVANSGSGDVFALGPGEEDPFALTRVATITLEFAPIKGKGSTDMSVADFDGDGYLDVATVDDDQTGIRVHLRRACGRESDIRRGDADSDGRVSLTDAIRVLGFLFLGAGDGIDCADAADADDDGRVSFTDAIVILSHLFGAGGVEPVIPGAEMCEQDSTPDDLPPCRTSCL